MKKLSRLLIAAIFEFLVIGLAGLFYLAYTMTYNATTFPVAERQALPWAAMEAEERSQAQLTELERLTLTTQDGLELAAWYAPGDNRAAVLFLHGHRASYLQSLRPAAMLHSKGYSVLLLDFRAHGQSQGEHITFGCLERLDAQAAFEYLLTRPEVDPQRIGLFGSSMGSATALLFAAQEPRVAAVVAQSPYTSLSALGNYQTQKLVHLPPFPAGMISNFNLQRRIPCPFQEIAPLEHIAAISPRPVFILMGGQDTMVDPHGAHQLYAAAREPKQLWFEPDVKHVAFPLQKPQELKKRVVKFFDQYLVDW